MTKILVSLRCRYFILVSHLNITRLFRAMKNTLRGATAPLFLATQ
jgi:hypothetical protein